MPKLRGRKGRKHLQQYTDLIGLAIHEGRMKDAQRLLTEQRELYAHLCKLKDPHHAAALAASDR
jgi:benzoyl-CoA reductase/2-hydroxyglutaryl-CoA dehydratase subunit BcrC/BadD/HgdB